MTVRPGEPWGHATQAEPDVVVDGLDYDLAEAVAANPGALIRIERDVCDIARAVGSVGRRASGWELPMDVLRLADGRIAVNAIVLGTAPDLLRPWSRTTTVTVESGSRRLASARASTLVVATGQFLRGLDIVSRGHPGDGRAEALLFALRPGERTGMRRRLSHGDHLPHPRITVASVRGLTAVARRPLPLTVDHDGLGTATRVEIEVLPSYYRLLV